MRRNKNSEPNPAIEQLAKTIAFRIIQWQSLLAARLNIWFNRFPKKHQQRILVTFCAISAVGLILCLLFPNNESTMNSTPNNYQSTHIGLPSGNLKTDTIKAKQIH